MDRDSTQTPGGNSSIKRRGVIAAIAGLGAAAVGKLATTPNALAASGGPVLIDGVNDGTSLTTLNGTALKVAVSGAGKVAINAVGDVGVQAQGFSGPAVFATNPNTTVGAAAANSLGADISSAAGTGARVSVNNGGSASGVGLIVGVTRNTGVIVQSNSSSGVVSTALLGPSSVNAAVNGITADGAAIRGDVTVGGTGLAGNFLGPVNIGGNVTMFSAATVNGNFSVGGNLVVTGTKSAAVPDTNGNFRLVYCVEAPESWFQDFGTGQIAAGGRATVQLRPDFANAVLTNDYHVVLTEYGNQNSGLYVSQRSATSFEVRASADKDPSTFGYMIVAKRKDVEQARMPTISRDRLFPPAPDGGKQLAAAHTFDIPAPPGVRP